MPDIMKMGKNPNFLGSWDLDDAPGKEVTLVIDKIVDEKVVTNGQSELCTVCHWTDKAYKPMILNVTNKKTICKLYKTKDTEKLIGKALIIGTDKVKAFGDIFDALRVRNRIPQVKKSEPIKCEACGKTIEAYGSLSAEQMAAYTKKKYGKALCADCAKEANSETDKA